jgi:hypothetical protein
MLIPMAVSIAAGVLFSSALTLVLMPSMLTILNDLRLAWHRVRYGKWPTREEVEPASGRREIAEREAEALGKGSVAVLDADSNRSEA